MNWLIKEEPTHYSFDDLLSDGRTSWTGVRNPVAQKHLQSIRQGDRIFFYHTGDVKAVVASQRRHPPLIPIRETRPASFTQSMSRL